MFRYVIKIIKGFFKKRNKILPKNNILIYDESERYYIKKLSLVIHQYRTYTSNFLESKNKVFNKEDYQKLISFRYKFNKVIFNLAKSDKNDKIIDVYSNIFNKISKNFNRKIINLYDKDLISIDQDILKFVAEEN